jgi:hypothetical protein
MKYINLTIDTDKDKFNCEYDNIDRFDIMTFIKKLEEHFDLTDDIAYRQMKKTEWEIE